ncbi:MAG: glycosyltransferase family 4 protein [Pseudomonadota bacterium]|nr:glycosyltransferase family 4 protein [Pseudomonadota bacterium]
MRILHIDPDDIDNPLSGGGPRRTYEICRRLASRHEITVLTPSFVGSTQETVRNGVRYLRLGRRIGNHGSSHHITFFFALPHAVLRHPHDLMVEDLMPPMSITFNSWFTRKPVIASVQWFFAAALSKHYGMPFYWGEKYGIRIYRNFIVLVNSMQNKIRSRLRNARIIVNPNGIDEDLFRVPARVGDFILFLGRVDLGQKGVAMLLRAYATLSREKRLPLVLAGFSCDWDGVEALARELDVGGDIRFVGRVDTAERARLLENCRFVCFPSREETFGMVITEACAAAKPVIHFDVAPMNEVANGAGCLAIEPFNIQDYARAIERFSNASDAEMVHRGMACRHRVQDYRWDNIARRQENFYLETIERSRSGQH